MIEPRFRVVFAGEIASGFGAAGVQQSMVSTFKIPEAQVAQLFSGRRAILKKDLDAAAAEQMRQTFAKIGAVVSIEPMEDAAAAVPTQPGVQASPPPPPELRLEPMAPPAPTPAADTPPAGVANTAPSARTAPDLGGPPAGPAPKLDVDGASDLYAPPSASLERDEELEDGDAHEPVRAGFGRGWGWIGDGARIFGRSIGVWILTTVVAFLVFILLGLIPIINIFAPSLLFPVFGAGLMIACHRLARGGEMAVGDLFEGFKTRPGALIGVGAVYLVGSLIVFGAIFAIMFGGDTYAAMMMGDQQAIEAMMTGPAFWLAMLGGMALLLPLIAMTWFAPALIALHDVPFGRALVWSMVGCFKNFLPFLLYSIIMMVFMMAAAIPLMLGWLVAVPILICSIYAAYRDIYLD